MYRRILLSGLIAFAISALPPSFVYAQDNQPLGNFLQQTLALHPAVKAAEKNLAKANASKIAARQYPHNPEIDAGFEDAEEQTKEIGISQTIDVWGRGKSRVNAATAEIEIASAEYDLIKVELLERLLSALGDNQKQLELQRLAQKRLVLSDRFLTLIQKFQQAGDIGKADVLTAEVNKSNAELQVAAAEAEVAFAQRDLVALVGERRDSWPLPIDVMQSSLDQFKPGLDKTPELRLARAILTASKVGIDLADKNWRPDPTIGVRVGEEGETNVVGLSLSIPLPVWNRGTGEKLAASADAAGKEFLVVDAERRLRARLTTAEQGLGSALSAIKRWRNHTVPTMKNQEKLLNRLAETREIGALEYLQQLNQLIETEALGIDLEQALWSAWITRLRAGANLYVWAEELK